QPCRVIRCHCAAYRVPALRVGNKTDNTRALFILLVNQAVLAVYWAELLLVHCGRDMSDTDGRLYNFSPGPAVMPLAVLREAQRDLVCLPGVGISALEISHRSSWFEGVLIETENNLRRLLAIPSNYRVLFLQGGSRLQFSMVPMNLLRGTGK